MKIQEIERMTETELRERFAPDFEVIPMKGYTLYLLEIDDGFGYSVIVFGDGRQIVYANDYELHRRSNNARTREELRTYYIEKEQQILFTDEELAQPLKSYTDFERRRKYISELLPLRRDFLSVFHIEDTDEERAERLIQRAAHPVYCSPAYGYFKKEDEGFADHIRELYLQLCKQMKETADNYDYQFSAFYYELGNHEYHINSYQGDWDTLSAFGRIEWHGQGAEAREMYFDELKFTETQRKAFNDARRKFLKDADENDWY